jgi:hypothetical protein
MQIILPALRKHILVNICEDMSNYISNWDAKRIAPPFCYRHSATKLREHFFQTNKNSKENNGELSY